MTKVRLMHVIEDLGIGGLERVVVTICRTIDRERFEPQVLCLRGSGPLAWELEEIGVPVVDIGGRPGTADYLAFWKVAREVRARRIDVVHTHNSLALFDGFAAARLAGVRTLVHTDHARDFPDKLRYMVVEHLVSHFIYRMVAVSEHTRDNLMRYEKISPGRIVTIPNGIDDRRFGNGRPREEMRRELGISSGAPVIGLGARLTEQKGVVHLLHAMVPLRERVPGVTLLVAGTGDQEETLQRAARELGVQENVRFLGARLDMPELLGMFDVYAMPSVWEGLPMALLEALAAGCPVVASDVGGIPTVIRHRVNGSLVPPRDPTALAEELAWLLSDEDARAQYRDEGRRTFLAGFSAEAMTRRYEALYLRQAT
jgi:glycosyltransferase involved in cell wall biosynthesis